jgi:uncharacterized protein YbdZ (MbtH family)
MFIVNIQDVRIGQSTDPKNPQQQVSVITYLNRQYSLVQVFPLDRLIPAQNLWRHLTDDRAQVCLIVKETDRYSVWAENIQPSAAAEPADPRLEFIFRTQLILIDRLWSEVGEILGQNQAAAFGQEVIGSIPTISSLKDLLNAITVSMQSDKSIEAYALSGRQLAQLYQDLQKLGGKYLGKNYTQELLVDFHNKRSPRINQAFQNWLLKESQSH